MLIEYIILAMLGSAGAAPRNLPAKTLGAEAIVQPNGGASSSYIAEPKKKKLRHHTSHPTRKKKADSPPPPAVKK